MMTMILNGSARIPINGYNRNIRIYDGEIHSSANFSCSGDGIIESLISVATAPITSIRVLKDETSIYDLEDLHARLTNISENIYEGNVVVSAQIEFDDAEDNTAENYI